jgi:hypothetical protein
MSVSCVEFKLSDVATHMCLVKISRKRCAPLSRGGTLLERGTYHLRGGDLPLSFVLKCGVLLELFGVVALFHSHVSRTSPPSGASSLLEECALPLI